MDVFKLLKSTKKHHESETSYDVSFVSYQQTLVSVVIGSHGLSVQASYEYSLFRDDSFENSNCINNSKNFRDDRSHMRARSLVDLVFDHIDPMMKVDLRNDCFQTHQPRTNSLSPQRSHIFLCSSLCSIGRGRAALRRRYGGFVHYHAWNNIFAR